MTKHKVLLSGPILTLSGYGSHCRFMYRALRSRSDLFDLYVEPTVWGRCRWLLKKNDEINDIHELILKTHNYFVSSQGQPSFDATVQVKLPTEWKPMAMVNVGVTSGIEATKVLPPWNQAANMMDLVLVESNHVKNGFDSQTPIEVISFPERTSEITEPIDLNLKTDFNFLLVSHLIPRKNVEEAILGFLQEFKNEENVGLVMKLGIGPDSLMDKKQIEHVLKVLVNKVPERKCKLYFIFGALSKEQVAWLYKNEKIKAMVSMTHGEGFGLPLFEAACEGMPVVCPNFGGQEDFLTMPKDGKIESMSAKVDFFVDSIKPEHAWQGIMETSQSWAYPRIGSYRAKIRSVYSNYGAHKKKAVELQKYLLTNLTKEEQNKKVVDAVMRLIEENSF